jgi:biotin carboxyl carrier protein
MRGWTTAVALVIAVAAGAGMMALYRNHEAEDASPEGREEPIVAPSRVTMGGEGPVVVLDTGDIRRIGLETAVLGTASATPLLRLFGEVIEEPERIASVRAPLAGRLAAPDGRAWPSLGDRVAAGEPLAQVSDARPLPAPIGGVVTRMGARPGEIVEQGQLLLEIVDRSRPVVRVIWNEAAGERPRSTILLAPGGRGSHLTARLIGPAAEADPLTRRPAFLYRAERAWPGAAPGSPVGALVSTGGEALAGALVPDRAVVQWEGIAWAYRAGGNGRFERRPVPVDRPVPNGWVVTGSLSPGDTVVVTGAQELLSEEFRAGVTVGDESGE